MLKHPHAQVGHHLLVDLRRDLQGDPALSVPASESRDGLGQGEVGNRDVLAPGDTASDLGRVGLREIELQERAGVQIEKSDDGLPSA
jgi:hypothetical protein